MPVTRIDELQPEDDPIYNGVWFRLLTPACGAALRSRLGRARRGTREPRERVQPSVCEPSAPMKVMLDAD
jgi:hypothetical protein